MKKINFDFSGLKNVKISFDTFKKGLSILFVNIVLCGVFLAFLEYGLYRNHVKNYPGTPYTIKKFPYKNILSIYKLRPVEGKEFESNPVILTGCSYAYGQALNNEETLGHKLSLYSARPVYNYSLPGKGLQNTLFMLQNDMFSPEIKNPAVILYVFMYDQIRRLYSTVCLHDFSGYPVYKLKKDGSLKLIHDYYPVYRQFYSFYFFNNIYQIYFNSRMMKKHSKIITAYFKAINNEIKRKYPGTKFAVLMYDDGGNNYGLNLKELENEGIEIIHTDDLSDIVLSDEQYHISKNDFHPSGKAWDVLIPPLVENLGLSR